MSNLTEKLKQSESGIFLYSLTPPGEDISREKLMELNRRRASRISTIDVDGLSIYDVQEEKDRNRNMRTYKYRPALDPLEYARTINRHNNLQQIIYLATGKYDEEELDFIFSNNSDKIFVLVGSPTKNTTVKCSLNRAMEISQSYENSTGAVLIGERHSQGGSEVVRMLEKIDRGIDFFISQCIYDGSLYEKLLSDYKEESNLLNFPMKPVILTFSPIGNRSSLEFMKWLGVDIPVNFTKDLPSSDSFLQYSIQFLEKMGRRLIDFAIERDIPIGINFESVISKRAEVLASLELAENLSTYLDDSLSSCTRYLNSGVPALSSR